MTATKEQIVSLRELVNPTPRQDEFLQSVKTHLYTLYGGAGGGGKSYILRWTLVALLMKWAKEGHYGVNVGLFCIDYPSLNDRHLSKIRREFPEWLGTLKEQAREFHLAPQYGGGVISFRNLDDPSKYKSVEFAAIAVDEVTELDRQAFDDLRWRRRWPGIDRCPFIAATNPTGIGHGWVKKLWIERDFADEPPALDPQEFAYIPAKATDNPHLSPQYLKELASLPDGMREALLEGSWDIFAGQAFSEWRRTEHVEAPWQLPAGTRYFTAADRGFAAPSCVLRFAVLPSGDIRVVGEIYGAGLITTDLGARWKALQPGEYAVADPAMWSKEKHDGEAEAEVLQRMGIPLRKADNDRINGKARVHEWLKLVNGQPRLKVWTTCPNLIRTLPALPYSKTRPEDVDTDAEDHAYDALRYGLMSRPAPAVIVPQAPRRPAFDPLAETPRHDAGDWTEVDTYE